MAAPIGLSPVAQLDTLDLVTPPKGLAQQLGLDWNAEPQEVARQFEAVFWSMVIKQLRESLTEDELFGGDPTGAYGAMFDLFLADHLARSQSLGVARLIERYLEARQAQVSDDG